MSFYLGHAQHIPLLDNSVQCVVTSPPYWGLRDYGAFGQLGLEATLESYVENLVSVFHEIWRVLKDDGVVWLNLGDSYSSGGRGAYDSTLTSKSSGVTNRSAGGVRSTPPWAKPKDLLGVPWRVAFALQADDWYLRCDIVWSKPNPMPESVTDRPTKSHEYIFLLTKNERYYYDHEVIKEPQITPMDTMSHPTFGAPGGKAEAVYGAKVSGDKWMPNGKRNKRSVWAVNTVPYPGAHFATFPERLIEPCVLAGSRRGDVVFDPFVGSGTTVKVAEKFCRIGIGGDCSIDYLTLAQERMRHQPLAIDFLS